MSAQGSNTYTTVAMEPAVRDSVNALRDELDHDRAGDVIKELIRDHNIQNPSNSFLRKMDEFGHSDPADTIERLIQYHDMLPAWVDSRSDLERLLVALPDETEVIIRDEEITVSELSADELCSLISAYV